MTIEFSNLPVDGCTCGTYIWNKYAQTFFGGYCMGKLFAHGKVNLNSVMSVGTWVALGILQNTFLISSSLSDIAD